MFQSLLVQCRAVQNRVGLTTALSHRMNRPPLPLIAGLALMACTLAVRGNILLNEIHLNPPGPDDNFEFIELKSTTNGVESCAGFFLVIINNDRIDSETGQLENPGLITEVLSLNDLSTGSNGLLLLGNNYTRAPRGGPWAGFVEAATAVADPAGLGDSDIRSNDGLTIILAKNFTALKDQDVDVDNDGIADWMETPVPAGAQVPLQPWTVLADSIGTRDRGEDAGNVVSDPYVPASANLNTTWAAALLGNRDPDSFARKRGMDTGSSAAAWYGAKLAENGSRTVAYRVNRSFGPDGMVGAVTPGRSNLAGPLPEDSFRINEVGLNPIGDDDRFQYVEIISTSGQARSLDGYWLVLVDSSNESLGPGSNWPGGGLVMQRWNLSYMATGDNGLLLIGNEFTSSTNAFRDLPSPLTGMGDPEPNGSDGIQESAFSAGDLQHKKAFTLFLTQTTSMPALDIDFDDDGIPNASPFGAIPIIDQIGFSQPGTTQLGRTYSSVDLRAVMPPLMVPDNFSRKPGDFRVDVAAWYGGEYPKRSPGFNVAYNPAPVTPTPLPGEPPGAQFPYLPWFGSFRGAGTPGLPNLSAPVDPAAPPVPASIRISEVMMHPVASFPELQDRLEYIELLSTNGGMAYLDGWWVVVVDMQTSRGQVLKSWRLDGWMTGLNGISIIARDFRDAEEYPYTARDGPLVPLCAPIESGPSTTGNVLPDNGLAVLLLRGPRTGDGQPFTLSSDGFTLTGDLDPDNDGVLLPPATLAVEVADSLVVSPVNPGNGYAWLETTSFMPQHAARYPDDMTPNSGSSFHCGRFSSLAPTSLLYTNVWRGRFRGAGSPGRVNHAATPGSIAVGAVVINEVLLDPPGPDGNFEFIELADTSFSSRSLNGYYLLMLDNSGIFGGTGAVRHAWCLDGMATGPEGLLLVGDSYPLGPAGNPWSAIMRPSTRTGDPPGRAGLDATLGPDSLAGEVDNVSAAFLLVRGFTGDVGTDLDHSNVFGSPGLSDGSFDQFPWEGSAFSFIHDSVFIRDRLPPLAVPPGSPYPWDGFTYGLADLSEIVFFSGGGFYHPDSFARFYGDFSPNTSLSWYGGDIAPDASGTPGLSRTYVTGDPTHLPFPAGFRGLVTPGQPNLPRDAASDRDRDGLSDLLELALHSNPNNPTGPYPLPYGGTVTVAGVTYPSLTFSRPKNGVAVSPSGSWVGDGYTYTVESSYDLKIWTPGQPGAFPAGAPVANPDGVTESITWRFVDPITDPSGHGFLRLRVSRD